MLSAKSNERLNKVHPLLAEKVRKLVDVLADEGIEVQVVQGLRTFAEQDALFAQGRTKPGKRVTNARGGQSNHNFGLAVDLCLFENGQPQWNDKLGFNCIGQEAERLGLEWGGRWTKLVDMPHVQMPRLGMKDCNTLFRTGGLQAVWDAATKVFVKEA